ncbi:MAG: MgtC/SapB family protein, partial [Planctomycetaceae bacterium]
LNPFKIWLMVVLIVGISLAAYVAYRLLGARVGSILGGVLGGLISSMATTVSYARQSRGDPKSAPMAALVILIASTIVNVRLLFEVGVVAPRLLVAAAPPLLAMMALMAVLCLLLFLRVGPSVAGNPLHKDPSQIRVALVFGALYAVVLFAVAVTKDLWGTEGMFVLAAISGLTDVDAISLSAAALFDADQITAETAWRIVLIASLSNLVVKAGAVAMLGSRRLLAYVAVLFGISLLGGGAILAFWPQDAWATWIVPYTQGH